MLVGRVSFFNTSVGHGFIRVGRGLDVFVHVSECVDGLDLKVGAIVEFTEVPNPRKPGQTMATKVRVVADAPTLQPVRFGS